MIAAILQHGNIFEFAIYLIGHLTGYALATRI